MLKIEIDKQSSKAMARGSTRDIMVETAAAVYAVASGLLRNCPDKCKDEFCSTFDILLLDAIHSARTGKSETGE